jgi:hypothetical protein
MSVRTLTLPPIRPSMALQPFVGPRPLFSFLILHTVGRTPWTGDQNVARPLPTHTTTQTDMHASSGIRTHDPLVRASEDSSCLRPHGHCDRQMLVYYLKTCSDRLHIQPCQFTIGNFFFILSGARISPLYTVTTSGLLCCQPQMIDDGDCGAIGGMKTGRGRQSTRRKPAPAPICPPQIPHDQTRARNRVAAVRSQRPWRGLILAKWIIRFNA